MQTRPDGIPRRNDLNLMTPAELAIRQAMLAVEAAGCHPLLTEAVVLLGEAQSKVADFVELPVGEPRQQKFSDTMMASLVEERGALVTSADCSEMEIAFARAEGRFFVDDQGLGYVLRRREWRTNAEAALHDVAEAHRHDKASQLFDLPDEEQN